MKEFALYAGIAMLLLAWLIVFTDILKHKFPNRGLWIMFCITTPPLTVLFYPLARKYLLKQKEKKG
jgi:hypothetical protein